MQARLQVLLEKRDKLDSLLEVCKHLLNYIIRSGFLVVLLCNKADTKIDCMAYFVRGNLVMELFLHHSTTSFDLKRAVVSKRKMYIDYW